MYYNTSYGILPAEYNTKHAMVNNQLLILLRHLFKTYKSQLNYVNIKQQITIG